MVRLLRPREVRLVTGRALARRALEDVVLVAARALRRLMRTRQRERGVVVEAGLAERDVRGLWHASQAVGKPAAA